MRYTRLSKSGHIVRWEPDDPEAAARAVASSPAGPGNASDAARELSDGIDLSGDEDDGREVAKKVREEYARLVGGKK